MFGRELERFASFSVVMAREFDDLGFWLPSEFLTDDDLLTDFKSDRLKTRRFNECSFGFGNSLPFNSDLSSPSDMVTSPTETESEDDDLVSELTRKLAQSTLRNSNFSSHHTSKVYTNYYFFLSLSLSLCFLLSIFFPFW